MSNLLAVMTQCPHGRKALVGDQSDIWRWEAHGGSVLGGVAYHPVATGAGGELALPDLESAVDNADDAQCAPPALLCLENTHGMCGGRVLSIKYLAAALAWAERHRIALHLDGARLFNAAVAMRVSPAAFAAFADTVSFSLTKGLGAPVGSMLAGRRDVIAYARRLRKMLGGGMRQAGIIAAAGIYAFDHMVDRLADDHATARQLADGLRRLPGVVLDRQHLKPTSCSGVSPTRRCVWAPSSRRCRAENVRVMELGAGAHPRGDALRDHARRHLARDFRDCPRGRAIAANGRGACMSVTPPEGARTMSGTGRTLNRNLFLLWQGQLVSLLGTQVFRLALVVWLTQAAESATLLGLLMATFVVPGLFIGPFGGVIADRYPRRLVLVACDLVQGVAVLSLGILWFFVPA
jgi:threonine aldolase